jgi:2-polyprenyl-3-methyl-5-hydroxy-6-metoxy-1,4-benzoquinol methylase
MEWDDAAAGWDDHEAVRAYGAAAYDALVAHLGREGRAVDGADVLDFGCGTGQLAVRMAAAGARVVGLDVSSKMIEVLQGKEVEGVTAVAGDLDAVDGSFDLITCSSVLAFVPDHPAMVRQLAARLRPGGWLVHWDWVLDPTEEEPYGLSLAGSEAALRAAGLVDVDVRTGFEVAFEGQTMAPLMGVGRRR